MPNGQDKQFPEALGVVGGYLQIGGFEIRTWPLTVMVLFLWGVILSCEIDRNCCCGGKAKLVICTIFEVKI